MIMKKIVTITLIIAGISTTVMSGYCSSSSLNLNGEAEECSSGICSLNSKQLNLKNNTQVSVYKRPVIEDSFSYSNMKLSDTFQNGRPKIYVKKIINNHLNIKGENKNNSIIDKVGEQYNINADNDKINIESKLSHDIISNIIKMNNPNRVDKSDENTKQGLMSINNQTQHDIRILKNQYNLDTNIISMVQNEENIKDSTSQNNIEIIPVEKNNIVFHLSDYANNVERRGINHCLVLNEQSNENLVLSSVLEHNSAQGFDVPQQENFRLDGIAKSESNNAGINFASQCSSNLHNAGVLDRDNRNNNKNIGSLDSCNHAQDGIIENIGKIKVGNVIVAKNIGVCSIY